LHTALVLVSVGIAATAGAVRVVCAWLALIR
jgi:hypothetical protein